MLLSSGPANMPGNNVRTAIFIQPLPQRIIATLGPGSVASQRRGWRSGRPILDDFEGATQSALGAACQQQGPDGIDCHSLPPNYFADILRMQAQFINGGAFALDWRYGNFIRILNQTFHRIFEEGLHTLPGARESGGHGGGSRLV